MNREADFSTCRKWRFSLRRRWLIGAGQLTAVMLNPSKADEARDDPTTTFMVRLAQRLGMDRYEAVNLFAMVDTDPRALTRGFNPIGDGNDAAIIQAADRADKIVIAWGNGGELMDRGQSVLDLLHAQTLYCFGRTQSGAPRFPRALRRDVKLIEWSAS